MRRAWLALVLMVVAASAAAHSLSVAHVDIKAGPDVREMQVEIDLALRDLALTLPLDANRDEQLSWGELLIARAQIEALVASHLQLSTAAGVCTLVPGQLGTRRYDDGGYASLRMTARCPSASALLVDYRLFFDQDPQHRALITMRRGDQIVTAIARQDDTAVSLPTTSRAPFLDFLREGVAHILAGYDHLAFLLSLLLPAALLRGKGRWEPVPKARDGAWHVLGIVTAFTAAHSITLSLAALGWVRPVGAWIEVGIAASIALAALNNLRPIITRRLWLVGFVFGLIHGFGFAGALLEIGLPSGARVSALLGFNLGVELGQLLVVAAVLPVLLLVRRARWYPRWALPAGSLAIAALAAWWLYQRLWPLLG